MSTREIVSRSASLACDYGFRPSEIWAKKQGTRSASTHSERVARALIVKDLREHGATLTDIGAVFGRRHKTSVFALERHGRQQQRQLEADLEPEVVGP